MVIFLQKGRQDSHSHPVSRNKGSAFRGMECQEVKSSSNYVTFMVCLVDTLVLSPVCGLAVDEMTAEKEGVMLWKKSLHSEPRDRDWSVATSQLCLCRQVGRLLSPLFKVG